MWAPPQFTAAKSAKASAKAACARGRAYRDQHAVDLVERHAGHAQRGARAPRQKAGLRLSRIEQAQHHGLRDVQPVAFGALPRQRRLALAGRDQRLQ